MKTRWGVLCLKTVVVMALAMMPRMATPQTVAAGTIAGEWDGMIGKLHVVFLFEQTPKGELTLKLTSVDRRQRRGSGRQRDLCRRKAGCPDEGHWRELRGDVERGRRLAHRNLGAGSGKPASYTASSGCTACGIYPEAENDRCGSAGALPNRGWQYRGIVREGFGLGEQGVEAGASTGAEGDGFAGASRR